MKKDIILFSIGGLLVINGLFMLLSVGVSVFYGEDAYLDILKSSGISVITGLFFMVWKRKYDLNIGRREGFLIVSLGWLFVVVSGMLPYLLTGSTTSVASAFFESSSGYTTTGSTIFDDVESLPKGILFWRSLTHWIGGMGIIVLVVAVFPLLGIGGMQLFSAEAPGIKTDKVSPKIGDTAKILWGLYAGYTIVQTLMLYWAGMNFFDAVTHSFASISSGGFSTKNISVAYWNNKPLVEYILIFFMFIAGSNFLLGYFFFTGKFKKVWQDEEFRWYLAFVVFVSVVVGLSIALYAEFPVTDYQPQVWGRWEAAFRHAFFQVISIVTTTGFITSDYTSWTPFLIIVFFGLMFVGGCSGSTSGGVKIVRHLLVVKNGVREFRRQLHPNAIIPTRLNGDSVSRDTMHGVTGFFVLYMLIFFIGALILGAFGNDFETSLSASATSLVNAGPGLGKVNPISTYSSLSGASKWCCSFLMIIGRLEIYTFLIIFTPYFWKKV